MDISLIVFIAFICLVIGFFTSRLLSSLMDESKMEEPGEEQENVVKVWHDSQTGGLQVGLAERVYGKMIDLSSKDRYRLQQILLELNQWSAPGTDTDLDAAAPDSSDKPLSKGSTTAQEKSGIQFDPVTMISNAIRADVPKLQPSALSIVSQIDKILQEKLKALGRGDHPIRLMEWPNKGMIVMIGLDQYNEIDDVPDDAIKELIRSAVSEWERRDSQEENEPL